MYIDYQQYSYWIMLEKSANDDDNDGDDDHDDDRNERCSENIDYMVGFFSKNHEGGKDNRLYSWHTVGSNKRQAKEQNLSNTK